jgi:hypothetical protein
VKEYPFRVRFSDEKAFDIGGVARDLFSAFFEEAYTKLFDGPSLLVPIDFPNFSTSPLPTFGTVVSHAYLVAGILPVKVAFPTLCLILKECEHIPDEVLIHAFVDCLDCHEASIVNQARSVVQDGFHTFPEDVQDGLMDIYSRLGVRESPKTHTFLVSLTNMAKYYLWRKPAASILEMKSGIPEPHLQFWSKMSISDLYAIYKALQVTPAKVLAVLDDAHITNQAQRRVFGYLKQFIGNMKGDELRNFLLLVCLFHHPELLR